MVQDRMKYVLVMLLVFVLLYVTFPMTEISIDMVIPVLKNDRMFFVNTEGCKIPKLDPYDPQIKHFLDKGTNIKCGVSSDIVYIKNKTIYIDRDEVNRSLPDLQYCKYDVIWRPPSQHKDHNFYTFVNESEPFVDKITVSDEFIRVRCYKNTTEEIYANMFSIVHRKPNVEKRCREKVAGKIFQNEEDKFNVLMLGVDSVSRSNMARYMPSTRDYLLTNMSAFELLGYNKIADNTFVNIVPMTTGKFVKELPWRENMTKVPFDKYDFIWNKFSRHGYRTLYTEDAPSIQIFDYLKAGFAKSPADYFNRPFAVAAEKQPDIWNSGHNCIHARPETEIMLDYLKQFVFTFPTSPYFTFTFITRLTHDSLSASRKADSLYLKFFEDVNEGKILNKTIIFFFSDHGIRFGKVRQTSVGKLEERLPFMFIIFPKWFLDKNQHIKHNIQINTRRLTTPFDVYQTLIDLLDFKLFQQTHTNSTNRGLSLLREITPSRTCESAGILPHWCTCSQHKILSNADVFVIDIAKQFVQIINEKVKKFPKCKQLSLGIVQYASRLVTSDKVLSFDRKLSDVNNLLVKYGERVNTYVDYQLTIQTIPGGALFEGTLRYNEDKKDVRLMGDISRINKYGNQSHCVGETSIKKFCYCDLQI